MGLKYYSDTNDSQVSDLLIQASIKTDNQLMDFSDSNWQDFPDTGRDKGEYIIFYQGGPFDHVTHFPVPVDKWSKESQYNAAWTAGMSLAYIRILIHEFLNKDPDIVPEEAPMIILDSKSAVCIAKNGKDTKHTREITRIMYLVRNGEKWKIHKIDWCEGGLQ